MNAATLIKLFESGDYKEFLYALERINDTTTLYVACGLLAARRYDMVDALIQKSGLMQVVYIIHDNLNKRIQRELDEIRYTALQVIAETATHENNPLEWFVTTYSGNLSHQDWIFTYNNIRHMTAV